MNALKRFEWMTVTGSIGLTLGAAGVGCLWDPAVGKGVLLGGLSGTLAFWLKTRAVGRISQANSEKVRSTMTVWIFVGWILYTATLVKAYRIDPDRLYAFFAAAVGLMLVRLVVVVFGVTGLDLKAQKEAGADGRDR